MIVQLFIEKCRLIHDWVNHFFYSAIARHGRKSNPEYLLRKIRNSHTFVYWILRPASKIALALMSNSFPERRAI